MQALFKILILLNMSISAVQAGESTLIKWQKWTPELFAQAQSEQRLILLDLEAVWCHWCHVMDQKTYANPEVADLIKQHFIAVKVDQDARPDLSTRYEEYGWPATIFFAADGTEIVKRRGYIAPERMLKLLQAIVEDPSPEKGASKTGDIVYSRETLLSKSLRAELERKDRVNYDEKLGGLPIAQKFLVRDNVEYEMWRAIHGDKTQEQRARQTLDAALGLLDPAWGGFYQYSTHFDWQHAHYEKIMSVQTGYMRIYALAYQQFQEPRYLKAADAVVQYLDDFLTSPDGAFYVSQDADLIRGKHSEDYFSLNDEQRRAQGIPRVDKHIYARENGWAIEALATLYEATLDEQYLHRAIKAVRWVEAHRRLDHGGFRHDEVDVAGPYLGDTLAMGRAYLQLYRVTAEREWLQKSRDAADFIASHFIEAGSAGVFSAVAGEGPIKPLPLIEENIEYARFVNLLFQYTGDSKYQKHIESAQRYLVTKEVATKWLTETGILLLDDELKQDPLHLTIVGSKKDKAALQLFKAALQTPRWYKRVEWWDRAEGDLPNPDVKYPEFKKAAAYVCTENRCSLPLFSQADLQEMLSQNQNQEGS